MNKSFEGKVENEKTPGKEQSYEKTTYDKTPQDDDQTSSDDKISLKNNIGLISAVIFIVVNSMGTGIFVVPSGIMRCVGSIGTSLLIWVMCGIYNTVLALCFAELGTAFPMAGGDYKYIQNTLGSVPGFMSLLTYVLLAPVATAVLARTAVEYLMPLVGLECHNYTVVLLAVFLNCTSVVLNITTVKWTVRFLNLMMAVKGLCFLVIIILGLVQLSQGNTQNFTNSFEGSSTSPSSIVTAVISAYTSFAGWELICSLGEEMKNPRRDIPLSLIIGVLLTTSIYVLVNAAFFTVLTPHEVRNTNTVGGAFAAKVIPGLTWIIPVMVAMSAVGTLVALYLALPRFVHGLNLFIDIFRQASKKTKQKKFLCWNLFHHVKYCQKDNELYVD